MIAILLFIILLVIAPGVALALIGVPLGLLALFCIGWFIVNFISIYRKERKEQNKPPVLLPAMRRIWHFSAPRIVGLYLFAICVCLFIFSIIEQM